MTAIQKTNGTQPVLSPFAQLLEQLMGPSPAPAAFNPAVDILEHENSFEIQVSAPGSKKEDFNIEIEKNRLTISGSRKFEQKTEGRTWHRIETQYGSFARTFNLPEHIKIDQIEARYTDGILHVILPKDEQKIKSSRIEVK